MATNTTNYDIVKPDLEDIADITVINANMDIIDTQLKSINNRVDLQNTIYTTTGTANTYSFTISGITNYSQIFAVPILIKINANSTAASTLNINNLGAKGLKKANGNDVTNFKANGIYTIVYGGTNFILQGEGGEYGTATANSVLSGVTFGTENGLVAGAIPIKLSQTYNPSTTAQTIASGQYLYGEQTINPVTGTATAADVANGKTFCSANGISLTGTNTNKRWASGTTTYTSPAITFTQYDGSTTTSDYCTITHNLGWQPSFIEVYSENKLQHTIFSAYSQRTLTTYLGNSWNFGYLNQGNLYVTTTAFQLPLAGYGSGLTWVAYE